MKKNEEKKSYYRVEGNVINVNGEYNQIMSNVYKVVQHIYCSASAPSSAQAAVQSVVSAKPRKEAKWSKEECVARGTLCIYYSDERDLEMIIRRISECRNAADLANLVVNDMLQHTILTADRMVSRDFIRALQYFLTFKSGTSTGNIRTQINNARRNSLKGEMK